MSFLKSALALAKRGFHVFPLIPNKKTPAIEDFPNLATRDPKQIEAWWIDPIMGFEQPYNVGISTTRFGKDEALLVLDIDDKGDKRGSEEILRLEMDGKVFPPTATQTTPTTGRHLIYRVKDPVKQGASVIGKGLDIRSRGGFVVGAGSIIDDKPYTIDAQKVVTAPEWLVEACGKSQEKETPNNQTIDPNIKVDKVFALERAVKYLQDKEITASGERNHAGFATAAKLKDFGLAPSEAVVLMLEHWKCEPMLDISELEHVVKSAYKYGTLAPGADAPESQFSKLEEGDTPDSESISYLEKMNNEYAIVYMEGSHFVLHETVDSESRPKRNFLTEFTFKRKFSPYHVQEQAKGRPLTWAEVWLDWKGRREYAGLCFKPELEPKNNYYNLWTGFTTTPLEYSKASANGKKGFDMFLDHALTNICHGDKELFNWLMTYFAHLIQKPYERPLTTLVFKGSKGTGKNALLDRVGNLLGSTHYLVAHDSRYLTSNFNGHMDSCLVLVLDEAFWSGDKSAEGKLKGLTTAPEILIERKGKEPYMVSNLVRIMIIGNEDWLVPASHDERRYAVFNVGEGRKQDMTFFANMRQWMDNEDGKRVLLHYLKTFDMTKSDVNRAPMTIGLEEQKVSSLKPFEMWWMDCLVSGKIIGGDFKISWPKQVDKETLRNSFRKYCKEANIRSWAPNDTAIGKALKKVAPSIETGKRREGEELVPIYRLPDLEVVRNEWSKHMGHEFSWESH